MPRICSRIFWGGSCRQAGEGTTEMGTARKTSCSHKVWLGAAKSSKIRAKSGKILQIPSKSFKILQNPSKSVKIRQNPSKSVKIRQNPAKSGQIRQNPAVPTWVVPSPDPLIVLECRKRQPNRASFRRKRRPEKFHPKSSPFFNAKFPGRIEEKIHKSYPLTQIITYEKLVWNNYFRKITNLARNSLKMSFFPGHFERTKCLKNYEK